MIRILSAFFLCLLANPALAQSPPPAPPPDKPAAPPPRSKALLDSSHIADNSFLIEEAYNQEYGVVQHISAFQRNSVTREWVYAFTQEWPVNPAPRHQLSYSITALNSPSFPGAGSGFGDVLLNYRYQFIGSGDSRVAFAPRISLLVPTGKSRLGRGVGGTGVQINLPLSILLTRKLVTHWNAGATLVPHAKNEFGDRAGSHSYSLGQSFVWLVHPRVNLLLETVYNADAAVVAPARTQREHTVVMNPAIRWAYNFTSGLQIVPGVGFPVEVSRAGRGRWGIFLYLSFEHPFRRGLAGK